MAERKRKRVKKRKRKEGREGRREKGERIFHPWFTHQAEVRSLQLGVGSRSPGT